ncbi:MAG: hypothetical protein WCK21_05360 [Actinomycetota bacterium]
MDLPVPTAATRAAWALSRACNGWRRDGRCLDATTKRPLAAPHPGCVRAQLIHDSLLADDPVRGTPLTGSPNQI